MSGARPEFVRVLLSPRGFVAGLFRSLCPACPYDIFPACILVYEVAVKSLGRASGPCPVFASFSGSCPSFSIFVRVGVQNKSILTS